MKRRFRRGVCLACLGWLAFLGPAPVRAQSQPAAADKINGVLIETQGVRMLRVWGKPYERGRGHGFLLAQDIINLLNNYVSEEQVSGGPQRWEQTVSRLSATMRIPSRYEQELRGLLAGIEERLDHLTKVRALNRKLRYEDLVAINCISDLAALGCSSFAAWGPLTKDGETIAGRNLDWHTMRALQGTQVIIAYLPTPGEKAPGWASITWPGLIGCLSGMNADGVTVCLHDVDAGRPEREGGFVPRPLALRESLESPSEGDPIKNIVSILGRMPVAMASNVQVTRPYVSSAKDPPAAVIEFVGHLNRNYDFGVRLLRGRFSDGTSDDFVVCTNHFSRPSGPEVCERFRALSEALADRAAKKEPLDVEAAWQLLSKVQFPRDEKDGLITYQAIVFEPNKRRMHLAFAGQGKPAPALKRVTLDVAALVAP
jgi:hypothetical protein